MRLRACETVRVYKYIYVYIHICVRFHGVLECTCEYLQIRLVDFAIAVFVFTL